MYAESLVSLLTIPEHSSVNVCYRISLQLNFLSSLPQLDSSVDLDERREIRSALKTLQNSSSTSSLTQPSPARRKSSVQSLNVPNNKDRRASVTKKRDFIAENRQNAGRRESRAGLLSPGSASGGRKQSIAGQGRRESTGLLSPGSASGGRRQSTAGQGRRESSAGHVDGRRPSIASHNQRRPSTAKTPGSRRESVVKQTLTSARRMSVAKKEANKDQLSLPGQERRKSQSGSSPGRRPSMANKDGGQQLGVPNAGGRRESVGRASNAGRRASNAGRRPSTVTGADRRKSIHQKDHVS